MNKVINRNYIQAVLVLFFLASPSLTKAQDTLLNKYGLRVISTGNDYLYQVKSNPQNEMADLKKWLPRVIFDLRYSSNNNFTKTKLYPAIKTSYLRKPAAMALAAVQSELAKQGLGLKIWDAYRPYAATEKMWALVQDDRYAANPKNGSGHNRGTSVDLTIVNLQTKQSLRMGTEFDHFSDTAHHSFTNLSKEILKNRLLLKSTMEKNGFRALETEWWHYSYSNGSVFDLMNIPFDDLKKYADRRKMK